MKEGDNRWLEWLIAQLGGWGSDWMWVLFRNELALALGIGILGWFVSHLIERRHLARLEMREASLREISVTQTQAVPHGCSTADPALLVTSAVLSRGAFRMFIITLRKLLGGRVPGYALLVERARREALVRLKTAARERGALAIINLRLETTRISSKGMPVVEVMAYGTALGTGRGGTARDNLGKA